MKQKLSHFFAHEATQILSIPLSRQVVPNRLCWNLTKDGKFSVRSTYRNVFLNSSIYSPIDYYVGNQFSKKLWKTCIPNKAKVHAWRLCIDNLPSLGTVASKRVVLAATGCILCGS